MSVSVVIPTWNRATTIGAAINSVMNQSYPVDEIIVVDDGSTDMTKNVVNSIPDERISFISVPHTGLPAIVRNHGISISQGEYIAFLDSDDVWDPSKLNHQIKFMLDNELKVSCTNARVIGINNLEKMHSSPPGYLTYKNLSETNWVICSSVVVNRKLLEKVGRFPDNKLYRAFEDWILWLRLSTASDIGFLDESLVIYNDNPNHSIRYGLSLETKLLNTLRTDILTWGLKKLVTHPSRLRLIKDMWFARKYLYKDRS